MAESTVILTGVKETLGALKKFDKDAVKKFNKVINTELGDAERDARQIVTNVGETPMRGWREGAPLHPRKTTRGGAGWPGWNTGVIQAGIRKSKSESKVRGDYTTNAGALLNTNAAGAIFETAGRRSKGKGRGEQFIRNLNAKFGRASRDIWRVVDRDASKIQANVSRALDEAKATLQKHLETERTK